MDQTAERPYPDSTEGDAIYLQRLGTPLSNLALGVLGALLLAAIVLAPEDELTRESVPALAFLAFWYGAWAGRRQGFIRLTPHSITEICGDGRARPITTPTAEVRHVAEQLRDSPSLSAVVSVVAAIVVSPLHRTLRPRWGAAQLPVVVRTAERSFPCYATRAQFAQLQAWGWVKPESKI